MQLTAGACFFLALDPEYTRAIPQRMSGYQKIFLNLDGREDVGWERASE